MENESRIKNLKEEEIKDIEPLSPESMSLKSRLKSRARKRKRVLEESTLEIEEGLPENTFEVEKNLHASAVKNNLDEQSVKKILKKVVTNDHVLALVKLKEEEEVKNAVVQEPAVRPKLTRSKVKELKKVSPTSASWDFDNLELTPIKHIPVKTRPEVTALIAQELPDDEDDEEYEPTHDDVPSDDDHMSCSDMESQPRTPATPRSLQSTSPRVIKDGPFKVPHDVSARRRLNIDEEEEATIALRTRSKLSLSETPIEHIESSFIPPDELPLPEVDDIWTKFIEECLDPKDTSRHEDDDEADPEYNVAADPDAPDEDEDALESCLLKIPKKELNDLATELFHVMRDYVDESTNNNISLDTSAEFTNGIHWEGKRVPISDTEQSHHTNDTSKGSLRNNRINSSLSIGKSEPPDSEQEAEQNHSVAETNNSIEIVIKERTGPTVEPEDQPKLPPLLKNTLKESQTHHIEIHPDEGEWMLPEQVLIFQQQLRMHIQVSASSFLQLHVHPVHWGKAPDYYKFIETFYKMVQKKPNSVANVCNLVPAMDLIKSWDASVSADTPENRKMIEFLQEEVDKYQRRAAACSLYVGQFHETFKQVVANSSVFLYPFLLPPMPFRCDNTRKHEYLPSEDALIALGLEQFSEFIYKNPDIWPSHKSHRQRSRPGYYAALSLVSKCMMPHIAMQTLNHHITYVRRSNDADNPIKRFFAHKDLPKVEHKLLPFNPKMTLYQQPAHEMPLLWVRYIAKSCHNAKSFLKRRSNYNGLKPEGVTVELGKSIEVPEKTPLHPDFTKIIHSKRNKLTPIAPKMMNNIINTIRICPLITSNQSSVPTISVIPQNSSSAINDSTTSINPTDSNNSTTNSQRKNSPNESFIFKITQSSTGTIIMPYKFLDLTKTTSSVTTPIPHVERLNTQPNTEQITKETSNNGQSNKEVYEDNGEKHCNCCLMLRKILRLRQTSIKEYFSRSKFKSSCPCKSVVTPKISNKLRLFISNLKRNDQTVLWNFNKCFERLKSENDCQFKERNCDDCYTSEDMDFVTNYQLRLTTRLSLDSGCENVKNDVYKILSDFNTDTGCPIKLTNQLEELFDRGHFVLQSEFSALLTHEQAERVGRFRDYFIHNCVTDLMKQINQHITDRFQKLRLSSKIQSFITNSMSSSCDFCCSLLKETQDCPKLAQYIFNLFPHKHKEMPSKANNKMSDVSSNDEKEIRREEQTQVAYEADHSSSGEENQSDNDNIERQETKRNDNNQTPDMTAVKQEYIVDTPELSITDTQIQRRIDESDDSSEVSMRIMSDDSIKSEPAEWKRDEDKIILEVLKQLLIGGEEKKTLFIDHIVSDKNIIQSLSEKLKDKKHHEIKDRIYYLWEMLSK